MKFLVLLCWVTAALAADPNDLCEILNLTNCAGVSKLARRSSAQSVPSNATATQFNPANVSHDRGWGVETMWNPQNTPTFSFVTGTGRTGAALVSSKIENGFFANHIPELGEDFLERRLDDEQYKSRKYTLALGVALLRKRWMSLDIGGQGKYNEDTGRTNFGVGASTRLGLFTFGAAYYEDDMKLKFGDKVDPRSQMMYRSIFGMTEFQETFQVQSYFAGVKIKSLYLDGGVIRTNYKFYEPEKSSDIYLYSAAYIWGRFLFNVAMRHERSPMWSYKDRRLFDDRKKNETYGGIQYSFGQWLILGIHHNYYLMREMAGSVTVFF